MDLSVIIPVFNDPDGIRTTLESLTGQTTLINYEVIVVDNGSDDKTREVVKEYCKMYPDTVFMHNENEIQSSYAARNTGISQASGEIIAFLDADMWVDKDYIQKVYCSMVENERKYMGCNVNVTTTNNSSVGRWNEIHGFPIERYIRENHFAPTCCLVVHKEIFEKLGEFDQRMISSGDLEFGQRVYEQGFKQIYEPDITVHHPARESFRSLIEKKVRIARGHVQMEFYHSFQRDWGPPPIWHPRNYLPVNPIGFYRKYSEKSSGFNELVIWFFIRWILKISRKYGESKEKIILIRRRIFTFGSSGK